MKNVKFTLGLALSMLFMGATVSNAAYDNTAPHNGSIKTSVTIKASEYYATSSTFGPTIDGWGKVNFNGVAMFGDLSRSWGVLLNPTESEMKGLWSKGVSFTPSAAASIWRYGATTTGPRGLCDYYYDEDPTSPTYREYVGWGLFLEHQLYDHTKNNGYAINQTWVALKMVEGLDVMPVITRTITYGEWYTDDKGVNKLKTTSIAPIIETLDQSYAGFKAYYDRESGVATFYYEEDILALMEKHIIYSIDYVISVNEIMDMPNGSEDGPINPEVTVMRGVTIDTETGIYVPNASAGIHYTPSNKNFTFTAYSDKAITVSTTRGRDNEGVKITDNKDGSYTVTIVKVQQDLTITVKSASTESGAGGEEGQTGNETLAENAVWAANGTLYVKTADPATLSIYSVTGQLYKQVSVSGSYSLAMSKGLYIVQLNGKAYKVVL